MDKQPTVQTPYILVFREKTKRRGWCNGKVFVSDNSVDIPDEDTFTLPNLASYPFQRVCVFEQQIYAPSIMYEVTIAAQSQEQLDHVVQKLTKFPGRMDGDFWMNKTSITEVTKAELARTKA